MTKYQVQTNGDTLGEYWADSPKEALDHHAQDAGYVDYAEIAAEFGNEAEAVEVA